MKYYFFLFIFILNLGFISAAPLWSLTPEDVAGRYRCYAYNVGGSGGSCRTFTTLFILNKDKTYTFGKSEGTYKIEKEALLFSQEKQRGPATFFDGNKFRFKYTSGTNGWQIEQTYLRVE